MMEDVAGFKCPLCGSDHCHTRLADGPVRVMHCTACGVAWRLGGSPAAPPALSAPHFDVRLIESKPGWDGPPLETADLIFSPSLSRYLGLLEVEMTQELKRPPGKLLNVGQDRLDFLENAKICGWNAVSVVDLAALPQQAALIRRNVDDVEEESELGGFDVIRMEGILERSRDPIAALRHAAQFQNPGGLMILSGADAGAVDHPLYGEGASLSCADLPRWFFTAKSLGLILRRAGLSVVRLRASQEPPHISLFARRSMRQQYRNLRRWIDPKSPRIQPRRQHLAPA